MIDVDVAEAKRFHCYSWAPGNSWFWGRILLPFSANINILVPFLLNINSEVVSYVGRDQIQNMEEEGCVAKSDKKFISLFKPHIHSDCQA